MKVEEAEKSRAALRAFGTMQVYPLCLGCEVCRCRHDAACVMAPSFLDLGGVRGDGVLEKHLAYAMRKEGKCVIVVICADEKNRMKQCACCCKNWESLIFPEEEIARGTNGNDRP